MNEVQCANATRRTDEHDASSALIWGLDVRAAHDRGPDGIMGKLLSDVEKGRLKRDELLKYYSRPVTPS